MKGVFRNCVVTDDPTSQYHDGHRGDASEPYWYENSTEQYRTVNCECGQTFTAFLGEFFEDRSPVLQKFEYLVVVSAQSEAQADRVMAERISHEEDYDFPYGIEWDSKQEEVSFKPGDRVFDVIQHYLHRQGNCQFPDWAECRKRSTSWCRWQATVLVRRMSNEAWMERNLMEVPGPRRDPNEPGQS